jgi:hypothetical protein
MSVGELVEGVIVRIVLVIAIYRVSHWIVYFAFAWLRRHQP